MPSNRSTLETDLETLRHDCAHLLAQAVKELYPAVQVAIGPAFEHGFYYDFAFPEPLTADELPAIEQRMREIVFRREPIRREEWPRAEADAFFAATGERFKQELLVAIPEHETISVYRQGEFTDLCRGPHGADTGQIGLAFKLLKLAGAYWRGDHRQPMLQRIYGHPITRIFPLLIGINVLSVFSEGT
ncbi:hypothetical protein MIT9_P1577 [Methylomarinovum caldicuralii]|uniref:threonine--tRNA ligase n=2 Tax=Methylomarinovum caldicuralii TaxID=438856 RepID=A0AAU9CG86_9GAMM|nr:hypothetical protein MIT9_P1577 [Methylomarinovum caldicuralii]